MIYILSAPIQSGKTTSLINWLAGRKDVYGILTPVINGKREFMNAETREYFPMEAMGEEATLAIGRFVFSKAGFDKAIQIIRNAITKEGWLVIDEIGPIELRGEGFCTVLKEVLEFRKEKTILVAREGMANEVKDYFNMTGSVLIKDITIINTGK
jgi:nucleoside-triphosphatase THEP1